MRNYIPLEKCEDRYLYRIRSRNLSFGVFNKSCNGFIGIREKFGSRFLFTEFHYDTGRPYGTVAPDEKLIKLPDDIELKENLYTIDSVSKRLVKFDKPVFQGGKGWYFVDTGESNDDIYPTYIINRELFKWLDKHFIDEEK